MLGRKAHGWFYAKKNLKIQWKQNNTVFCLEYFGEAVLLGILLILNSHRIVLNKKTNQIHGWWTGFWNCSQLSENEFCQIDIVKGIDFVKSFCKIKIKIFLKSLIFFIFDSDSDFIRISNMLVIVYKAWGFFRIWLWAWLTHLQNTFLPISALNIKNSFLAFLH